MTILITAIAIYETIAIGAALLCSLGGGSLLKQLLIWQLWPVAFWAIRSAVSMKD